MPREFQILDNVFAEEVCSTAESYHFAIVGRMHDLPNVSTQHGTIDIHCPHSADGRRVFRATVTVDNESFASEHDPQPSHEQMRDVLFQEFNVGDDVQWAIGMYEVTDGIEDAGGPGIYGH